MEVTIQVPKDIAHQIQEKWGQDIPAMSWKAWRWNVSGSETLGNRNFDGSWVLRPGLRSTRF